ncbi:GNAT family N-acetyltransferase [Shewanella sp. JM162201]|uniref:GNAT family N-acetyltransferase n=1 Tax=Shewanella jiangmenensis TaxID=2837387 RepID=A0ABS5V1T1_9GAMM|nr:GNAT family N-acetyltransferase [Shewanella jiangmenensis]MBT1444375.1 GNAT family N-acetyltransferase [Shewanella jiangmenensis]
MNAKLGAQSEAQINISPAALADAADIQGLTGELGYASTEAQTLDWLSAMLESPGYGVFVARSVGDGTISRTVGWVVVECRLSLETGYKAEITGLVVSASHRRLGIGEALVARALQWSDAQGLDTVIVRSNVNRDASHHFYRALGFSLSKTSHVYQLALS